MKTCSPHKDCIGLDRLATYDEVCYALTLSAEVFPQQGSSDGYDDEAESAGYFDAGYDEQERVPRIKEKPDPSR